MNFSQIFVALLSIVLTSNAQLSQSKFFKNVAISLKEYSELMHVNATSDSDSRSYDDRLCVQQFAGFLTALTKPELWAIKVADSWGKIPSGFLQGNLFELGNYDECLAINHGTEIGGSGAFKGQYCLAGMGLSNNVVDPQHFIVSRRNAAEIQAGRLANRAASPQGMLLFNLGICIPNTCSPKLINELIQSAMQSQVNLPVNVFLSDEMCHEVETIPYSEIEIFAIVFFSFIALFMVMSTGYELIVIHLLSTCDVIGSILMSFKTDKNNILAAFSVYNNGEKLFKTTSGSSANVMECVNGIRVLSIVWVIYSHSYVTFILAPTKNLAVMGEWLKKPSSMLLMGATVSVDSFFLLSGLLVAWSMLRHLDQNKGRLNIPMLYFHRYLRLTPALAAAILMYVSLLKRAADGPLAVALTGDSANCDDYWWSALLYVQNYVNRENVCLGHSWYLSVDMQLFILSPLIVWPMWRFKSKFTWIVPLVILLTMQCVFATSIIHPTIGAMLMNERVYFATHHRAGAWLVGILLGFIMNNFRGQKLKIPSIIVVLGWTIALGSILAIIFGIYPLFQPWHVKTDLETAVYESFSRVSWGVCLSWIIFACVNGYGGPINWFLSATVWQPLSRLSYSLYLVHFPVQFVLLANAKASGYFSDVNAIHKFWGDFGLSLSVALVWTLAFESPVLVLEKLLLKRERNTSKPIKNGEAIVNGTDSQQKV